jgi:elongation factor P--beta-lysine ligase
MTWLLSLLPMLSGWKAAALAFAAGIIAGGLLALKVAGWQEAAAERDRLAVYARGLAVTNAANEAAHALELADRERALAAAEAAAAAERERADALARQVDAIRAIPEAENCALGLETMKLLEGLM